MPQAFVIIDGYNLMHAAGMAPAQYGPGGLERCRERFLRFLRRHLRPPERARTTVVFDAADAPEGLPRRTIVGEMEVLFAEPGRDADAVIEDLIAEHSAPRQLRLVSSDHRLQRAARRQRARFVDSDVFFVELVKRGPLPRDSFDSEQPQPEHPKYGGRISPAETAAWLKIFGEVADMGDPKAGAPNVGDANAGNAEPTPTVPSWEDQPQREPVALNELRFWQARVAELADELDDGPVG